MAIYDTSEELATTENVCFAASRCFIIFSTVTEDGSAANLSTRGPHTLTFGLDILLGFLFGVSVNGMVSHSSSVAIM